MAIRMGTACQLYRSRIVEIENEKELRDERCRIVCIASIVAIAAFTAMMFTEMFDQMNILNKCSSVIGLLMISSSAYMISRASDRSDIMRTLMCTGIALFVSSLFVLI